MNRIKANVETPLVHHTKKKILVSSLSSFIHSEGIAGLCVGHPWGMYHFPSLSFPLPLYFVILFFFFSFNCVVGICANRDFFFVFHLDMDKTDTVKVRLQSKELAAKYSGTWNCFSTILKQEKV